MSLLRRLADSLRQHHWTGVAIELAIVVIGVFIGLQAANWNEARKDRAMARQYLERLREDFVRSAEGAEDNIETMDAQARKAGWMLDRLRDCRLEGDAQQREFANALFALGRIEPPLLTQGTIDELRSTGRLGIIGNLRLRRAMSDVGQEHGRSVEVLGYIVARRSAPLAYVDARSRFPSHSEASARAPSGMAEVGFDFAALCRDPVYINNVSHLGQAAYVIVAQHRRLLKQYRAIVAMLDVELAQPAP